MTTQDSQSFTSGSERLSIASRDLARLVGTIHDDEVARGLGFESAFVPGSTVGHYAFREVIRRFGPEWLHGGWYTMRFHSPVYITSDVRTQSKLSPEGELTFEVEDLAGRSCMTGRAAASLGERLTPWDDSKVGTLEPDAAFPGFTIGQFVAEMTVRVNVEDVAESLLGAANDSNPLFRSSSPSGPGVVAPAHLMLQSLYSVFDQIKKQAAFTASDPEAGIWAEQSIIQHRPVHFDTDYRLTSSIADKGRRQRADFVTIQSLVIDESGATVATLRQGAKWLRADSAPDNFLGIL